MTEKCRYLVLFLVISFASLAQTDQEDCFTLWGSTTGIISSDIIDDDCSYEIEDWDNPNHLSLPIFSLVNTPNTNIRHFQFFSDLHDMRRDSFIGGKFRTFDILDANGDLVFAVEFEWEDSFFANSPITISALTNGSPNIDTRNQSSVFAAYRAPSTMATFEIQLSWKPSTANLYNGWVELHINGKFVARKNGLNLTTTSMLAPAEVRYGLTEIPSESQPLGVYRMIPRNPTPFAFHL